MRLFLPIVICLLLPLSGVGHAQQTDSGNTVTVYRCTDSSGKQSLRDSPCPKGQKQQTREMVRPKDAPKRAALAPTVVTAPPAAVDTRTVYITPPRPMYECVTPDGERYTSETADGNPRWAPFWTQGYRYYDNRGVINASRDGFRPAAPLSAGISTAFPRAPSTTPPPPHVRPPRPWQTPAGGGQWIRDACTMLPPREACSILRDRRDAIRTRFFNAQEKERDVLRVEERSINARLANDC